MYSLYELTAEYRDFLDAVERGDIPDEAIADTLEAMQAEFDVAADNIATIIKTQAMLAQGERDEARRLTERARTRENRVKRMSEYLTAVMVSRDCKRRDLAHSVISVRKSKAVEISNPSAFVEWAETNGQDELLTFKEPEPNKTAIRKALEMGGEIEGVSLVERDNLQVR